MNDAADMARILKKRGFDVSLETNANLVKMENAVRKFGKKLKRGGVGLFYYAGHGLQVKGTNYLVPIGSDIQAEDEIRFKALNAGFVLNKMETAENSMNIVILDACRDNPFARSFRSSSRGLARMDAPKGTLIVYATSPGSVAADGKGRNGIFTEHLIKNIEESKLEIGQLLREVRKQVLQASNGRQLTWESSSIMGEFFFSERIIPSSDSSESKVVPSRDTSLKLYYGFLETSAHPYAELFIDGKRVGEVPPLKRIKLAEGNHEIVFKRGNDTFKKEIFIGRNKTEKFFHQFR